MPNEILEIADSLWKSRPENPGPINCIYPILPALITALMAVIETAGPEVRTRFFFMHPRDFADLRIPGLHWADVFTEDLDSPNSIRGVMWNAYVLVSPEYESGMVWASNGGNVWSTLSVLR